MTPTVIRATKDHLNDVAVLFDAYRQWYGQKPNPNGARTFLAARLEQSDSAIFVALDKSKALGFTQLYPSFSSIAMRPIWILNDLFVVEKARRRGVGAQLLMAARDHALQSGAVRLVLSTAVENITAQALYERQGWLKDTAFLQYKFELPREHLTQRSQNDEA